ncbi:helix-turn-helix domain-containing protein [Rhizobium sp. AQ_MP]|uniref:helix-turn-helix domain-containing protein n=1 Tax=Rhizobium sp. AQ_MP TaxID=2761536 RepID=UPI00387E7DD2
MATVFDGGALVQLIRTERKRQQLTQEQLASVAGVGVRRVRELESGKEGCRVGDEGAVGSYAHAAVRRGKRSEEHRDSAACISAVAPQFG